MSTVVIHAQPGILVDKLADQMTRAGLAPAVVRADPVGHDLGALTARFAGARVVHHVCDHSSDHGHDVLQAALRAGCHYLDTSDEHDWLLKVRDTWHQQYAAAGLLLLPGLAQPFATSEMAANLALETPGAEILDVAMLWRDVTTESTVRQLEGVVRSNGFDTTDPGGWPLDRTMHVRLPGHTEPGLAIRLGESPHCLWFDADNRVSELRTYEGTSGRSALARALVRPRPVMDDVVGPTNADETPLSSGMDASIDWVWSRGSGHRTHVVLEGHCPYDQTAALHARAALRLCTEEPARVGFASGCQAFGHRDLLDALTSAHTLLPPRVTVDA